MLILYLIGIYMLLGLVFAVIFLIALIKKVDEGAAGATLAFKLIIFPGCVVLWPFLLRKYMTIRSTPS